MCKAHSVHWYEHANIFLTALSALCCMLAGRTVCSDIVLYAKGNVENKGSEGEDKRINLKAHWPSYLYQISEGSRETLVFLVDLVKTCFQLSELITVITELIGQHTLGMRRFHPGTGISVSPGESAQSSSCSSALMLNRGGSGFRS